MSTQIKTRLLILSDTHGEQLNHSTKEKVDVVIHCGDLTEESKLDEFKSTLTLLQRIDAPTKLIIAGNHDFTLDNTVFKQKVELYNSTYGQDGLLEQEFGTVGQARQLFESVRDVGIKFLDEGIHQIPLPNGAMLTVYASPYTPSPSDMGFQYDPIKREHNWAIDGSIDVAITHGPPHGLLDYTARTRAGSPSLFKAIAQAKPRLHCFGHIHESWGAKLVTWRHHMDDDPTHFTAIDNDASTVIETLASMRPHESDNPQTAAEKQLKRASLDAKGYCRIDKAPSSGSQTLFVNAAIEGPADKQQQWPWMVDIDLPRFVARQ